MHGITTERALAVGVPERDAVQILLGVWRVCTERVAHNESFDARLVRIAIKRLLGDDDLADAWKAGPAQCTARLSTNIVQLPPTDAMRAANRNHWKTPNLSEAYRHFTGQELEGAHSAMVDVHGCATVFFGIQDLQRQVAA